MSNNNSQKKKKKTIRSNLENRKILMVSHKFDSALFKMGPFSQKESKGIYLASGGEIRINCPLVIVDRT